MSLISEIKSYLKARPYQYVHKGELERLAFEWGREVSNVDRRCREMTQKGHGSYWPAIEKSENEKGHRMYRYNPEKEPTYQPKISIPQPLFQLTPQHKSSYEIWAK